ncbi:MAG: hypothetical protein Q8P67_18040 [archaeon]|nr:hypothetical protein [archaeon]
MTESFSEEDLLRELNSLRTDPEGFAERVLVPMLPKFQELRYLAHPDAMPVRTFEGVAAVQEAIEVCRTKDPVGRIERVSPGLTRSAQDLVRSNGPRGALDNVLADGTTIGQRIVRYGKWRGKASETISFGNYPPREAIAQWIIDDGNTARSQQATLLEPRYKVVGIASGPHKTYEMMTVIIFAEDFEEGADASDLKYSSTTSSSLSRGLGAMPASSHPSHPSHQPTAHRSAENLASGHPSSGFPPPVSSQRSESVLASDGDRFILETDPFDPSVSLADLKLRLEGLTLILTVQSDDGKISRTRTLKWELPFEPRPLDIDACFKNHRLRILIDKPRGDPLGTDSTVHITSFALSANQAANRDRLDIEVQQTETTFVCTPLPSRWDERVSVEHHNGDELRFICTHEEVEVEDGNRITKEITLTRIIRLPYAVPSTNIQSTPSNVFIINKAISHAGHSALIDIRM